MKSDKSTSEANQDVMAQDILNQIRETLADDSLDDIDKVYEIADVITTEAVL